MSCDSIFQKNIGAKLPSVKSSRAYSLRNICKTSLSVVSGVVPVVCQSSMTPSQRKPVKNWSFCSSVMLFWNGFMWLKSRCSNSL